jgi:hypothetical protein
MADEFNNADVAAARDREMGAREAAELPGLAGAGAGAGVGAVGGPPAAPPAAVAGAGGAGDTGGIMPALPLGFRISALGRIVADHIIAKLAAVGSSPLELVKMIINVGQAPRAAGLIAAWMDEMLSTPAPEGGDAAVTYQNNMKAIAEACMYYFLMKGQYDTEKGAKNQSVVATGKVVRFARAFMLLFPFVADDRKMIPGLWDFKVFSLIVLLGCSKVDWSNSIAIPTAGRYHVKMLRKSTTSEDWVDAQAPERFLMGCLNSLPEANPVRKLIDASEVTSPVVVTIYIRATHANGAEANVCSIELTVDPKEASGDDVWEEKKQGHAKEFKEVWLKQINNKKYSGPRAFEERFTLSREETINYSAMAGGWAAAMAVNRAVFIG